MKFRFHRGGLRESMATQVEVHSIEELAKLLGDKPEEIEFEYSSFDERTGWDTYYVMVGAYCAGMSDSNKFKAD